MAPAAAFSEGAASGAARPPRPLPAWAGPGRPGPDSGRPRGLGPSFGEDEGTPSDWDPRNARMTEEEEAIARRQAAELRARAAGHPPPPPCSASAPMRRPGADSIQCIQRMLYLYYLRWIHITICRLQLTYLMNI